MTRRTLAGEPGSPVIKYHAKHGLYLVRGQICPKCAEERKARSMAKDTLHERLGQIDTALQSLVKQQATQTKGDPAIAQISTEVRHLSAAMLGWAADPASALGKIAEMQGIQKANQVGPRPPNAPVENPVLAVLLRKP